MKYVIASDLHGDGTCIAALLERCEKENAGGLILLGDLLGRDEKAAALLNTAADRITAVRGNCDREADRARLRFPVAEECCRLTVDGLSLFLTHGHIYDPLDPPPLAPGDIMLSGHTHVPASSQSGGVWFLNPGSVSLPRRGSPHSYLVLENGVFLWKTLAGEVFRELCPDDGD